ncbi:MAG: DNA mismatch repair endonuclease MutL [Myxococcota bacterium]
MIRILEDRVVNKIAAGEVVERPASVIKELVENAIDARATDIRVEWKGGGRNLIRVTDNGIGMDRADATLALERHATSKIRDDKDLFSISTLGFRGEAIPSIASVSRFELLTRPADQPVGTRITVEGGRLVDVRDAGAPSGTRVTARSLFFNIPARRKFLRAVSTELSHCLEAVVRQALIRPELDVEVSHGDQKVIRAPVVSDMAARAADLLGAHGTALVPVSFKQGELKVIGMVSPVGVHKGSPQGSSYLYVNDRFVQDRVLRRAINEAYRGIVPKGRYPTVVLKIEVPPDHVDVNVHPAKTEVRFRHVRDLTRILASGLRETLQRHGIKQPVPTEARYQPSGSASKAQGTQQGLSLQPPPPSARPLPVLGANGVTPMTVNEPRRPLSPPQQAAMTAAPPMPGGVSIGQRPTFPPQPAVQTLPQAMIPRSSVGTAPALRGSERSLLPVERFTDLRVIGQLGLTYILCEGAGEMVIIDQHAAHERITLHRLMQNERKQLGGGQRMLTPQVIELTPARALALSPHTQVLNRYGLEVEPFGGEAFVIKQVPESLMNANLQQLIEDVADDLAGGGDGEPARDLIEKILATMACHNSIRAGQRLNTFEMRELLASLDQVDFSVCAHGRPVSIRISPAELERRFHRS